MPNRIIDHYTFRAVSNTQTRLSLNPREKVALNILNKIFPDTSKKYKFADLGCGEGVFANSIAKRFENSEIYGCDYCLELLKKAQKLSKKIQTVECNLEEGIPFESNKFDFIYLSEILEHMYNPDFLLEEIHRVLKETGYLLLSTPNLCAWYNRILLLFGIQPLFIETSVKWAFVGAGPLRRFKKETYPIGHVRVFNFQALKDLLTVNGFKIVLKKGGVFEVFPKFVLIFDSFFTRFPNLASEFIILEKKEK
jgi:SAM-dependent methyltransferase